MYGLSEATIKADYTRAIGCHESSIALLQDIIDKINEESLINHFNTINSLKTLKLQIEKRIDQLRLVQKSKESKQLRDQTPIIKESSAISVTDTTLTDQIRLLMAKDLNYDMETNKVKFIDQEKINQLEHELQLLNFKEKSSKQQTLEEAKLKTDTLTDLNLVYYSELMASHEFIKDLLKLLGTGPQQNDIDQYQELKTTIDDLQQKLATQERDRILLENQIIKLKERWNNLVESALFRNNPQVVLYHTFLQVFVMKLALFGGLVKQLIFKQVFTELTFKLLPVNQLLGGEQLNNFFLGRQLVNILVNLHSRDQVVLQIGVWRENAVVHNLLQCLQRLYLVSLNLRYVINCQVVFDQVNIVVFTQSNIDHKSVILQFLVGEFL
ncbi:hypothetical protein OGAPHI_002259 [Ogataea philodendri]|uniref:Uncharacterized protein n=1 Tax=Ogataea philodendri TaxID=1378263 RepID=A0A9P8PB47_9ASCO|nr:uncharacterized protein OGAPHI_002259 [Ogataea philodendri]KAH3668505.1 hypothetical protein OGAPHI_002259 [Ogataea philodendri]